MLNMETYITEARAAASAEAKEAKKQEKLKLAEKIRNDISRAMEKINNPNGPFIRSLSTKEKDVSGFGFDDRPQDTSIKVTVYVSRNLREKYAMALAQHLPSTYHISDDKKSFTFSDTVNGQPASMRVEIKPGKLDAETKSFSVMNTLVAEDTARNDFQAVLFKIMAEQKTNLRKADGRNYDPERDPEGMILYVPICIPEINRGDVYLVNDVAKVPGTPKADFAFTKDGHEEIWISHKKEGGANSFQQYSGVTEEPICSMPIMKSFAKALANHYVPDLTFTSSMNFKCRLYNQPGVNNDEVNLLVCKSIYGKDYNNMKTKSAFGRQNVQVLVQGFIDLIYDKSIRAYIMKPRTSKSHIHYNGDLFTGDYEPVINIRYTGANKYTQKIGEPGLDKIQFQHARCLIYPIATLKNKPDIDLKYASMKVSENPAQDIQQDTQKKSAKTTRTRKTTAETITQTNKPTNNKQSKVKTANATKTSQKTSIDALMRDMQKIIGKPVHIQSGKLKLKPIKTFKEWIENNDEEE